MSSGQATGDLIGLLSDRPDWMDDARCISADASIFFPSTGGPSKAAERVCAICPVHRECLQYALDTGSRHGVWGGTTHTQRKRIGYRGTTDVVSARCGTASGYNRHLRAGEDACVPCRRANAAAAQRRAA